MTVTNWYDGVGVYAKMLGVLVSIISIKGEECSLAVRPPFAFLSFPALMGCAVCGCCSNPFVSCDACVSRIWAAWPWRLVRISLPSTAAA